MGIQQGLQTILDRYASARAEEHLDSSHPLWGVLGRLEAEFSKLPAVMKRSALRVRWSLGQGAWARVPWLALLDQTEARFTSDGVYVIYLFRQDMSGVYLTLNQGVSKLQKHLGRRSALTELRRRAGELRRHCKHLERSGFALDSSISLVSDHNLGADYEAATIAHKLYQARALPEDDDLTSDLEQVLQAYGNYLRSRASRSDVQR